MSYLVGPAIVRMLLDTLVLCVLLYPEPLLSAVIFSLRTRSRLPHLCGQKLFEIVKTRQSTSRNALQSEGRPAA